MGNVVQWFFISILGFGLEHFILIPIFGLILIGFLIERHYVSRLTFFSNALALFSYAGLQENLNFLHGVVILAYFLLTAWSFLAHTTQIITPCEPYEQFIENNPWVLKIGSSFVVGVIILLDLV